MLNVLDHMEHFKQRRQKLLQSVGKGNAAILWASNERLRNRDAHYPFRQNSDFYYLTGFNEPEAVMLLIPGREDGEFILFNRERNEEREIWDGPRAGQMGACEIYGANESLNIAEFDTKISDLLGPCNTIFYLFEESKSSVDRMQVGLQQLQNEVRKGTHAPDQFADLSKLLHEMRLFKDDYEIECMRYVGKVSAEAHQRVMSMTRPGLMEYQLEAEILYDFADNACRYAAYTSIVAGGGNSCILHYVENNDELKDGDLLLIDAGGEFQNYAADITRTFPINGKFTEEQAAIYSLVLDAQLAAIGLVKPGTPWDALQAVILRIMTAGLIEFGILSGDLDQLLKDKAYLPFYMHNSGHWLGLDVHDVGQYKQEGEWRSLEAGMVLTVEPGIYIRAGSEGVDKKWWDIGVRIEDDVLVTESGYDVLSEAAPKSIEAIEALVGTAHVKKAV